MFRKKPSELAGLNLLDLKPQRQFEFEVGADDSVVLLIPKFRDKFLGRYLQPYLKRKFYKVKLDRLGSFVWLNSDGRTTVNEIAERLRQKFGAEADPALERVTKFMQHLQRGDCVTYNV